MRSIVGVVLLGLGLALAPLPSAAATRLGLQVTQEELDIWRARRTDTTNTINGFTFQAIYTTRILGAANTFLGQSTPRDGWWAGHTGAGCFPNDQSVKPGAGQTPFGRGNGAYLLKAAFVRLLEGNTTLGNNMGNAVRDELVRVAGESGLNWNTTSKFCVSTFQGGANLEVDPWFWRLVQAYDYLTASGYTGWSAGQQNTVETWLYDGARFLRDAKEYGIVNNTMYKGIFATPQNLNVTGTPAPLRLLYFGGPTFTDATWYPTFNQMHHMNAIIMAMGIIRNDTSLINHALAYYTAFLKIGLWDNGAHADYDRWDSCNPECPASSWAHMVQEGWMSAVANMYSRWTGTTSLFTATYPTEIIGGSGGTVGLEMMLQAQAELVNGTRTLYGTASSGEQDTNHKLTWRDFTQLGPSGNGDYYWDFAGMVANVFYHNATIRAAMNRNAISANSDTTGCADIQYGGCFVGNYSSWVDLPFLWGKLDNGEINPYSLTASGAPTVTITTDCGFGVGANCSVGTPTFTQLQGTASDDVGVSSVSVSCVPSCGTPTVIGTTNWSVASLTLQPGPTVITVTATDAEAQPATDTITVTMTGPVACWSFDGVTTDSSGFGHTGTLQGGATYGAGQIGQALSLDGTNDYVSVTHAADLNITGDLTLLYWANLAAVGHDVTLVTKDQASGTANNPYTWKIANAGTPNYKLQWHLDPGDFSSERTFTSYTIPTNTWHHVAVTRNVSTEDVELFINGVSVQVITTDWTDNPGESTVEAKIGANTALTSTRFVQGRLDELCLYNRVLSPAEIAAAADVPVGVAPTVLRLVK